jgi:glycosyltransferase involved in cell wall biosynthesis
LHRLFDALRLLQRKQPERLGTWRVHLFGNPVGGRNRNYVDRIWSDELSDHVRFRGSFEPIEAPRILAGLDAVVVPSQWTENAPLTVLQARIAGLPLVASDVPGVREVLEEGPGVRCVGARDARALAEAMEDFVLRRPSPDPGSRPVIAYAEHLDRIEGIYGLRRALLEPAPRVNEKSRHGGKLDRALV